MTTKLSEYPEESEFVVGVVREVKGYGAFVVLDEYPGKEGFVHISEVAPGWVKYIRDHIRESQRIVCKVLKIDEEKRHVDLSLKQVNDHQRRESIKAWKNEARAEKLLSIVAETLKLEPDAFLKEVGVQLIEKFDSLYGALEECALDPKALENEGFKGKWTKEFLKLASENIVPPSVRVKGTLQLTCSKPDGIDHIRKALIAGESIDTERIKVLYLGAPRYRLEVQAEDYKVAEELLRKALVKVEKAITSKKGTFSFAKE